MRSIYKFAQNAIKKVLETGAKTIIILGSAGSAYAGGKEIYKDIKSNSNKNNSNIKDGGIEKNSNTNTNTNNSNSNPSNSNK